MSKHYSNTGPQSWPYRWIVAVDPDDGRETVHGRMPQSMATARSKHRVRVANRLLREQQDAANEQSNRTVPVKSNLDTIPGSPAWRIAFDKAKKGN